MLIAAVAIGMVGCTSQEEVTVDNSSSAITFQTVNKKAARGGLNQTVLTDPTDVYCSGLLHGAASSAFHFENELFQTVGSNTWGKAGVVWPIDGTLDFWAYSCSDYIYSGTSSATTITTANNVVPGAGKVAFDVVSNNYSKLSIDFEDQLTGHSDVMVSDIQSVVCSTRTPPMLTFKHAMSWIIVNISSSSPDDMIKFYSISLDNVKLSGKLEVDAATLTPVWTPFQVAAADATTTVKFPAYGNGTEPTGVLLGTAKTNPMQGIMVLPQAQTSITINYAYKDSDGNYNNMQTHQIRLFDDPSTYVDWEAGKKYTYNININPQNITFTSAVTGYDEVAFPQTL